MTLSPFSSDYSSARDHFRKAVGDVSGAQLESITYPVRGPSDEELTTDVAWIGPRDAPKVLVTVSGTHGVEGFCGSGAQIDWLERREALRLPPDTAALLIHAINPYGFAWKRRVTHENVDLNRNWVDFSAAAGKNKEYSEIADIVCPAEWGVESRERDQAALHECAAKYTFPKFVQIVSGGQHTHPEGLFYGGKEPTVARTTLASILAKHLSEARSVGIIDYHSGLGPPGFGELIASAPI
ncbi:MAG TPA: DUF2817 domain-containing protein, partial [Povalibacter sp.]